MTKKIDEVSIEKLKQEISEWQSKYLRALADYQNLEKRVNEQKLEIVKNASERIIRELLPVIDTLEKAEVHLKDAGLTLGIKNFQTVLAINGLEKIAVAGRKFDPHEMECIEVVGDRNSDDVIEELRPGYKLGGRLIRAAQVKVGKLKNR